MMQIQKSALVPYSAKMMYDLVADVDRYSEFLPWCSDSRVDEVHEDGVTGSIEISRAGVRKWFTTRNTFNEPEEITLALVDGPFQHLQGRWQFIALDENACKIVLDMDFEFSSRLVALAFGAIFTQIVDRLIDSFCKRARNVYE